MSCFRGAFLTFTSCGAFKRISRTERNSERVTFEALLMLQSSRFERNFYSIWREISVKRSDFWCTQPYDLVREWKSRDLTSPKCLSRGKRLYRVPVKWIADVESIKFTLHRKLWSVRKYLMTRLEPSFTRPLSFTLVQIFTIASVGVQFHEGINKPWTLAVKRYLKWAIVLRAEASEKDKHS